MSYPHYMTHVVSLFTFLIFLFTFIAFTEHFYRAYFKKGKPPLPHSIFFFPKACSFPPYLTFNTKSLATLFWESQLKKQK